MGSLPDALQVEQAGVDVGDEPCGFGLVRDTGADRADIAVGYRPIVEQGLEYPQLGRRRHP